MRKAGRGGKRWQAGGDRSEPGERAYQKFPAVEEVRLERDHVFVSLRDADPERGGNENPGGRQGSVTR